MQLPSRVDVAVVGAGPAGLTTATTLRQDGINAIVLGGALEPSKESRATIIHSRTLKVLEDIGITSSILKKGLSITQAVLRDRSTALAKLDFSALQTKYATMVTLPQSETEGLLRKALHKVGGTIFWSTHVTAVSNSGDEVRLQCDTSEGRTTITAAYVVAADGLKSSIRETTGIGFVGGEYDASFVCADARLDPGPNLQPDALALFLSSKGLWLMIPIPNGIWRVLGTVEEAAQHAEMSLFQQMADERGVPGIVLKESTWTSRFHIHHRLADRYRKGRIFIAGDAAHVHSPAGGQGMNTGIQDGARLGQIISEALKDGKTSDTDLDRHKVERRPVARNVVAMTHRLTLAGTIKSPSLVMLRNWFIWMLMSISAVRYMLTWRMAELEH